MSDTGIVSAAQVVSPMANGWDDSPPPMPRRKKRPSKAKVTDLIVAAVAQPAPPAVIVKLIQVKFADMVLPREQEILRRIKVTAAIRRAKALGATLLEVVSLYERL